ncbi:hypothetical protein NDU88_007017 [Pleurodeles waltl]|uniref:Uncharacterized protein n=1 Tax=Pleurodeles waltl TaxID=8319 RepID=A0AAV7LTH4_PLEWA|nr:hypothetical protein NDU88_007017 [Pleurodeles waltl]
MRPFLREICLRADESSSEGRGAGGGSAQSRVGGWNFHFSFLSAQEAYRVRLTRVCCRSGRLPGVRTRHRQSQKVYIALIAPA